MEATPLPGSDPMHFGSKALEQGLRKLQDSADKGTQDKEQLRKVSRELEAVFVRFLLDSMQKTVPRSDGLFGDSPAQETWRGLFNEKLAGEVSETGSIGLADMIYRQLDKDMDRHMEVPPAGPALEKIFEKELTPRPPAAPETATAEDTGGMEPAVTASAAGNENPVSPLDRFRSIIERAAESRGLDPGLVSAVIMQESAGNPRAVSPAGARGLMQLMPATAESLGVRDSFDPEQNIEGGTLYLRRMLDRFGGDEQLALAAYNAGPGAVERYGGVPPYRETLNYVRKVAAHRDAIAGGTVERKEI